MSEITLHNFTDLLDPDLLDRGRAYQEAGKLKNIKVTGESSWTASFEEKKILKQVTIDMTRKEVSRMHCDCADHHADTWEDNPCVHAIALLYAIKNGGASAQTKSAAKSSAKLSQSEKVKKKLEKEPPKRKKSAEETLLEGLERHELQAFILAMIGQNKEFNSQFKLYFSKNDATSGEQFKELISQSISAIKGRRKYLPPGDAAKIATALTALYKRAVEAETKGYFSEAVHIIQPAILQCSEVYENVKGESVRFNTFVENCFALRSQILKNPNLPFALKEELYEYLIKDYTESNNPRPSTRNLVYTNLADACRATKRVEQLVALLEKELQNTGKGQKSYWLENPRIKLVRRLVDLYDNDLNLPAKSEQLLISNNDLYAVMLMLIKREFEAKRYNKALGYIKKIKENPRLYRNQESSFQIERTISNIERMIYQEKSDSGEA